jgi:hypothetical protein
MTGMGQRTLTIFSAMLAFMLLATAAFANNPHFVQGPNYNATVEQLTATGKAAGLGNAPTAAFLTADRIDVYYQCQNRGQNFAPGHPATFEGVTGSTQNFTPRNGQITFNVSLQAPIPSAGDVCPNRNWSVVVFRVDYIGVRLHIQQNSVDILTDGPHNFTAP